jgi:hypothetical protein
MKPLFHRLGLAALAALLPGFACAAGAQRTNNTLPHLATQNGRHALIAFCLQMHYKLRQTLILNRRAMVKCRGMNADCNKL